jgi:enoyl-CoA hydratase
VNVGLLPGAGGTQKLPRLVGEAKALELMLLGRTLSPREALSVGLVSEVVDGPVLPRARALARELAGKSPRALAHIKRLVRSVGAQDRAKGLADERTLFCDLMVRAETIALLAEASAGRRDIRAR